MFLAVSGKSFVSSVIGKIYLRNSLAGVPPKVAYSDGRLLTGRTYSESLIVNRFDVDFAALKV